MVIRSAAQTAFPWEETPAAAPVPGAGNKGAVGSETSVRPQVQNHLSLLQRLGATCQQVPRAALPGENFSKPKIEYRKSAIGSGSQGMIRINCRRASPLVGKAAPFADKVLLGGFSIGKTRICNPPVGSRLVCSLLASLLIAWLVAAGPGSAKAAEPAPIQFQDLSGQVGIHFRHTDGSSGQRWVIEPMTAGLATFDYDGDGWIDIYFLNGAPLPGYPPTAEPPRNALYRNLGNWQFAEVTLEAAVGDQEYGLGVAVGDYNNDGFSDVYISNFGANVLYRNNGDGTFSNVTELAQVATGNGIPAETKVGAGVCFLDYDVDGNLDIYCANYMRFRFTDNKVPVVDGIPRYAGPKDFDPEADILFRNNGEGSFSDESLSSGIGKHKGTGMGIVALDYDRDGDSDVAVMNDVRGNFLFENHGNGRFEEVALDLGVAYNIDGMELASMGVDAGDFDGDGWLDLFQTSYSSELPALYRNTGTKFFEDVTRATGVGLGTYQHVTWGTGFGDFDHDGHLDLFIACGHLQDNVELYDDTTSYRVRNVVMRNIGRGKFVNLSEACGDGLRPEFSSRGIAIDDLDNDGRLDVAVLNSRDHPTIIRNTSPCLGNHWVQIRLIGREKNREAVGTRVEVVAGGRRYTAEVHSGRGYQSHFGSRLHFGLGRAERIEKVEVYWLGSPPESWSDLPVDQRITLIQKGPAIFDP